MRALVPLGEKSSESVPEFITVMYIGGLRKIIQLDNLEGGIYNIDNVYFG